MSKTHSRLYSNRSKVINTIASTRSKKPKSPIIPNKKKYQELTTKQIDDKIAKLTKNNINIIICEKQTKVELVQYLHTTYLSSTIAIFTKAINNNYFTTWLGLIINLI